MKQKFQVERLPRDSRLAVLTSLATSTAAFYIATRDVLYAASGTALIGLSLYLAHSGVHAQS